MEFCVFLVAATCEMASMREMLMPKFVHSKPPIFLEDIALDYEPSDDELEQLPMFNEYGHENALEFLRSFEEAVSSRVE